MKKMILTLAISCTLLSACTYRPIIDTAGRSGTFNEDKAREITNDTQHCKTIAKENSTFVVNILYWSVSPTLDTKYESIMRKCLTKRGHSVLN
tara:strand:- start:265 stop:543 length:279 start_codon:yes stop_codon:yes gene_type:complete